MKHTQHLVDIMEARIQVQKFSTGNPKIYRESKNIQGGPKYTGRPKIYTESQNIQGVPKTREFEVEFRAFNR